MLPFFRIYFFFLGGGAGDVVTSAVSIRVCTVLVVHRDNVITPPTQGKELLSRRVTLFGGRLRTG